MNKAILLYIMITVVISFGCIACDEDNGENFPSDEDGDQTDDDDSDMPINFVVIPGGVFQMGCVPDDTECEDDENPRHQVTVSSFEMMDKEVTQTQYEEVVGSHPSYFRDCHTCPVETVRWPEAKEFCETIGARLPSEAEWEYAARAGTTTKYACGDHADCMDAFGWFDEGKAEGHPSPVGQKTANDFGLYDMYGNIFEWNEDCWHDNYEGHPGTGAVWEGGDCTYRVLRGGSWGQPEYDPRASDRHKDYDFAANDDYGFRCVRDIGEIDGDEDGEATEDEEEVEDEEETETQQ